MPIDFRNNIVSINEIYRTTGRYFSCIGNFITDYGSGFYKHSVNTTKIYKYQKRGFLRAAYPGCITAREMMEDINIPVTVWRMQHTLSKNLTVKYLKMLPCIFDSKTDNSVCRTTSYGVY